MLGSLLQQLWTQQFDTAADTAALVRSAFGLASADGGRWDSAWLLSLLEGPPPMIVERRPQRYGNSQLRQSSLLWYQGWTSVAMTGVGEMDSLATRRREMAPLPASSALRGSPPWGLGGALQQAPPGGAAPQIGPEQVPLAEAKNEPSP